MSDHLRKIALERARAVLEDGVWSKLSRKCQLGAIEEELRIMGVMPGAKEHQDDPRVARFVEEFTASCSNRHQP